MKTNLPGLAVKVPGQDISKYASRHDKISPVSLKNESIRSFPFIVREALAQIVEYLIGHV